MQSQEAAFKGAEDLLRAAEKEAPSIESSWQAHQQNGKPAFFNIFDKLRELYVEESTRTLQQPLENLRPCSHLLEKLIQREKLNTLVVNLYPGTKGYSLQIKMQEGDEETQNETVRWPYSNDELLSYIDNEELPPFLADLLDHAQPRLYYSGCIIAEVRDYRQYHPTAQHSQLVLCDIHHVLLKPSNQSILNDVDAIVSSFADEEIEWSLEDKLALEGALILAKTGPLCLDPSPAVGLMRHNLHNSKHVLNTPSLRQRAKKYSQTAINRKRKLDQLTKRPETVDKLADFIASHKRKSSLDRSAKKPKKETEPTPQGEALTCEQAVAEIMRLAKLHERPLETNDCSPMLVEEHVLETGHDPVKVGGQYYIKISIYQRLSNGEFIGKLYFNKESEGGRSHGSFCKFSLSSRAQVNRLIQQFTEVTTQDGKECFRISHIVPGHPARVTCTAAMRERDAKIAAQQQQQQALIQLLQQQSQQQQKQQLQQAQLQQQQQQLQQLKTKMPSVSQREQIQQLVQQLSPQSLSQPLDAQQQQQQQLQQAQLKQLVTQQLQLKQQNLNRQIQKQLQQQQQFQQQQLQQQQISQQVQLQGQVAPMQLQAQPQSQIQLTAQPSQIQVQQLNSLQLHSPSSSHHQPIINNLPSPSQLPTGTLQYATTAQPIKHVAQKPVSSVGKRISSVNGNSQNPNSPLAASPGQMLPSPTSQVISSSNGDIASSPSSSSNSSQPVKSPVMFTTNRAINALALSLMNSAQQFQEEAAAAAAAQAAAAAAQANASASSANAQTINVQNLIQNNAGQQQQTVVTSGTNHNNHSAILSLLNSTPASTSPSVANPTLNNLLKNTGHIVKTSQFNPQVVAGKMTLTNLLNSSSAVTQAISSSSNTPVRVSLASLANLNQPLNQSMSQPLQKTRIISAQHLNNDISNISINSLNSIDGMSNNNTQFIAYAGNNVQSLPTSIQTISGLGSGSIQTLAGTLTPAPSLQAISTGTIQGSIQGISGVQSVGSVQTNLSLPPGSVNVGTIRRVSVTSVNSQQSSSSNPSASTSSIGLSMPGLKALLAGAPAGDSQINVSNTNNSLLERLSTPPSYPSLSPKPKPTAPSPPSSNSNLMNLSIASLQDAMSTIPGLQNVQVSIGGISVPITVSLNVSPHINASQAVSTLPSVVSAANPAAMIFTNSSNSQLLSGSSKTQNVRSVQAGNINVIQNNAGSLQLLGTLQKTNLTTANKQHTIQQQRVINNQRFKVAAANAVINQHQLSTHQQIQLALQQKQAAQHSNRNTRSEN